MDYWRECIEIALDECGLNATDEQVTYLVDAVKGGHENYGMAHGYDCVPEPSETQAKRELAEMKRQARQREEWKLSTKPCRACTTTGSVRDVWGRDMTCPDCNGKGRV
jgi:hypothetical protein